MTARSSASSTGSGPRPVPEPSFRWTTRVALPLAIFAAFAALFAGSVFRSLSPAVEVDAVPVIERPAINRVDAGRAYEPATAAVQAAGWIEPDPFPVHVTTLIDGTVKEVSFLEGDPVAKDEVLVRLIDEDARLMLERAEAEARAAQEAWDANIRPRRDAEVADSGVVKTGASLELARAELDGERALLHEAEQVHMRRKTLAEKGYASREELDVAEAAAKARAARVRVAEQRLEELQAELKASRAEHAAANSQLELRTEERRRLDLARVALAEARLRLERTTIRSPIEGVVMHRMVEPGSRLAASSDNPEMANVAALYDPKKLQVRVDVPLADVAKVGVGQAAQVTVEMMPDSTFTGRVTRIANFADIQKNTLQFKVALENPAPELKPDMLARVRFLAAPRVSDEPAAAGARSVFAPSGAVEGGAAWVITRYDGEEGLAAQRAVTTTGAEHNGWQEVGSGLQPGDLVVVSPSAELQPNQRVRVRKHK